MVGITVSVVMHVWCGAQARGNTHPSSVMCGNATTCQPIVLHKTFCSYYYVKVFEYSSLSGCEDTLVAAIAALVDIN